MLKYIEEFDKYVVITGFRNIKMGNVERFLNKIRKEKPQNVDVQLFDARFVATWQHLYFATLNALTVFKNKENISKSIEMEIMLYASAQRQIRKAMELLGVKPNATNVAMLLIGDEIENVKEAMSVVSKHFQTQPDDLVLELSKEKTEMIQKTFAISDMELKTVMKKNGLEETLVNLVIERMALLVTKR